jgi:glutamate N-acetyltransferase/amino-acid N-acetyltransferase
MRWISGGVTAARGFTAAGLAAGIKRSRKPDLALVAGDGPVSAAAVFTANRVQAAPVALSRARLRSGRARAVLISSGCANCMTGRPGFQDAVALTRRTAVELGASERDVLMASTGLIGTRLPVAKIRRIIPTLVSQLHRARHADAAAAMLTTDLHVKEAAGEAVIAGRLVRIGGMAKGAGMIAPSMATMLCVLTTDAAVAPGLLRRLLRDAASRTFNCVSIDGDMSTNDTVFALASGRSGVTVTPGPSAAAFSRLLAAVAGRLAHDLVKDGVGATRLMEICVSGGRTDAEAQACARQVARSPLVKTMLAGGDPNVGRIAAAAGASGAQFDAARLRIWIGEREVVSRGVIMTKAQAAARRLLNRPDTSVCIDLGAGKGVGRMVTCDLTEDYVRINASYST